MVYVFINKTNGAMNMFMSGTQRRTSPTVRIIPGCNEFDVTPEAKSRFANAREKSILNNWP